MAKRTSIDKMGLAIEKALKEYGDDVSENLNEITQKFAKAGVSALRSESQAKFGGTGAYARGWSSQFEETRLSSRATLYNTKPGLPHLLENGHANRGGGRTSGRPHIAPIEEKLAQEFEAEVKSKL